MKLSKLLLLISVFSIILFNGYSQSDSIKFTEKKFYIDSTEKTINSIYPKFSGIYDNYNYLIIGDENQGVFELEFYRKKLIFPDSINARWSNAESHINFQKNKIKSVALFDEYDSTKLYITFNNRGNVNRIVESKFLIVDNTLIMGPVRILNYGIRGLVQVTEYSPGFLIYRDIYFGLNGKIKLINYYNEDGTRTIIKQEKYNSKGVLK